MDYVRPCLVLMKSQSVAFLQTGQISGVSLDGMDEGCPTFEYSEELESGTYDFTATYTFNIPNACSGSGNISGTATVDGFTIIPECSTLSVDCATDCESTPNSSGEVCIQSATLNGVEQEGLPLCDTLDATIMDAIILACEGVFVE